MKQVFIQLDPDKAQPYSWLLWDSNNNEAQKGMGPLESLAPLTSGRQVTVLIPGEHVVLTEVDLQIRQAAKLRKALPYALEDQLSEDVDDLHFAFRQAKDKPVQVAVINEEKLRQWLAPFEEEGITLRNASPDTLAIPWSPGSWSIVVQAERSIIRVGETEGFVAQHEELSAFLGALAESGHEPEQVNVWRCENSPPLEWPETLPSPKEHSCEQGFLALVAREWNPEKTINLLQGPFSADLELTKHLKPWRWAAALLIVWLGIVSAGQVIDKQRLEKRVNTAKAEMVKIYRQTFPEARKVPNPRVQMEQKLKALKGGVGQSDADFLHLLSISAPVIASDDNTALEGINYRRGKLTFQFSAKSLGELEKLKEKLASTARVKAELLAADSSAGKATGQIRVSSQ